MKLISVLIFLSISHLSFSQSKKDLEKEKNKSLTEIQKNTQLINIVVKQKKENITTVKLINNKIVERDKIIKVIDKELNTIESQIESNQKSIDKLNEKRAELKKYLSSLLYMNYKLSKNYNPMMMIFSSKNINDVYKKVNYFKNIKLSIEVKIKENQILQREIVRQNNSLSRKMTEKEILAQSKERERENLKKEKEEKETILKNLSKREKELRSKIAEQKRIAAELEAKIKELSKAVVKKSNSVYTKLTPQEKILSDGFAKNKGKLPWPTEKGAVTSHYGQHEHPVLKGVIINNNGIDITTESNSNVRVIYDGVVTKVFTIKGCNYVVIVRHGNFLSVYQNLSSVTVKNGDKLKTKQIIGNINIDDEDEVSTLHFEIWEELNKHNPVTWLSK